MNEQVGRAFQAIAILCACFLPIFALLSYLVWPPKRKATMLAWRSMAILAVLFWPLSLLYSFFLEHHDSIIKITRILTLVDTIPLVFIGMKYAVILEKKQILSKSNAKFCGFIASIILIIFVNICIKIEALHKGRSHDQTQGNLEVQRSRIE